MTFLASGAAQADGGGYGLALALFAIAALFLLILGPIALIIGRDANRHSRNGWLWGVLFLWQPVGVGVAYLIVRRRPPRIPSRPDSQTTG